MHARGGREARDEAQAAGSGGGGGKRLQLRRAGFPAIGGNDAIGRIMPAVERSDRGRRRWQRAGLILMAGCSPTDLSLTCLSYNRTVMFMERTARKCGDALASSSTSPRAHYK